MTSIAAMISNMDKVNMSVAIVPMMASMGWSTTVAGVLQVFHGLVLRDTSWFIPSACKGAVPVDMSHDMQ